MTEQRATLTQACEIGAACGRPCAPARRLVRAGAVALHLFQRDMQYIVRDGKVQIVDEYTGRVMPDRSWEHGLHQLIEAKEAGRSPDARDAGPDHLPAVLPPLPSSVRHDRHRRGGARRAWPVYGLRVVRIPTNRPCCAAAPAMRVFAGRAKWDAVVETCGALTVGEGRPVLVGTRSVEASEQVERSADAAGCRTRC